MSLLYKVCFSDTVTTLIVWACNLSGCVVTVVLCCRTPAARLCLLLRVEGRICSWPRLAGRGLRPRSEHPAALVLADKMHQRREPIMVMEIRMIDLAGLVGSFVAGVARVMYVFPFLSEQHKCTRPAQLVHDHNRGLERQSDEQNPGCSL